MRVSHLSLKRCMAKRLRWLAKIFKRYRKTRNDTHTGWKSWIEGIVDANFAGNWDPKRGGWCWYNSFTACILNFHAGCPILWKSQRQTEIALSSTESDFTGLSYALREAIPIMNLFIEMIRMKTPVDSAQAKVIALYSKITQAQLSWRRFQNTAPGRIIWIEDSIISVRKWMSRRIYQFIQLILRISQRIY